MKIQIPINKLLKLTFEGSDIGEYVLFCAKEVKERKPDLSTIGELATIIEIVSDFYLIKNDCERKRFGVNGSFFIFDSDTNTIGKPTVKDVVELNKWLKKEKCKFNIKKKKIIYESNR